MTEQPFPPVVAQNTENLMDARKDVELDAKTGSVVAHNQFQKHMALQDEVAEPCGAFRSRDRTHACRYRRHGTNPGSIRIQGQRVRDTQKKKERPLDSYRAFYDAPEDDGALMELLPASESNASTAPQPGSMQTRSGWPMPRYAVSSSGAARPSCRSSSIATWG